MRVKEAVISLNQVVNLGLGKILWVLSFSVPLFFGHPQLVVGTVVNAILFTSTVKLSKKELLPIILLPSIGALSRGILFGPFTPFLLYFMPFIWIGNYLLISVFVKLQKVFPSLFRVFVSAAIKALFLFLAANVYFRLNLVPQMFLKAMGIVQFITAMLGGFLAFVIISLSFRGAKRRGNL